MDKTSIQDIITKVQSKVIGKEHKEKIENYLYFEKERKKHRIKKIHIYYNERNIYCFFPIFDTTTNDIYQDKVISLLNGPGLSYVTARDLEYELGIDDKEICFDNSEVLISINAHFNILKRCDFIIIKTNKREFKFGNMAIFEKGRELEELYYQDKFISSFQTSYQIVHNKPVLASISAIFEKEANMIKYLKKTKTFFFIEVNKNKENFFFFHFNYLFTIFFTMFLIVFYSFYLTQNIFSGEIIIPKSDNYQISNDSKIYTDYTGIVHIHADNLMDSIFCLGFIHARDRLWQMELTRRLAKGRISEVYGNSTSILDKNFKNLGIDQVIKETVLIVKNKPKLYETLTIYTQGINLFSETQYLPFEFYYYNLKFERWHIEDSISCLIILQLLHTFDIREEALFLPLNELFSKSIKEIEDLKEIFKLNESFSKDLYSFIFRNKQETYNDLFLMKSNFSFMMISQSNLIKNFPSVNYFVNLEMKQDIIFGSSIPGIPCLITGNNNIFSWSFNLKKNNQTDLISFKGSNENINQRKYDNRKIVFKVGFLHTSTVLECLISIIYCQESNEIHDIEKKLISSDYDFDFIIKKVESEKRSEFLPSLVQKKFTKNEKEKLNKDYIIKYVGRKSVRNKRFLDLIKETLSKSTEIYLNDIEKIMNDNLDYYAVRFVKAFLSIIKINRKFPEKIKYYNSLSEWDGKMSKNSYLPTIYSTLSLYTAYHFFKKQDKKLSNLMRLEISWALLLEAMEQAAKIKLNLKACNLDKVNDKFNIHYTNKYDCQRFFLKIFESLDTYLNDYKYSESSIMNWGEVNESIQRFPLSLFYNTVLYDGSVNSVNYANSGYLDFTFATKFYTDNIIIFDTRNNNVAKLYLSGSISWNFFSNFKLKKERNKFFEEIGNNNKLLQKKKNMLLIKPTKML